MTPEEAREVRRKLAERTRLEAAMAKALLVKASSEDEGES